MYPIAKDLHLGGSLSYSIAAKACGYELGLFKTIPASWPVMLALGLNDNGIGERELALKAGTVVEDYQMRLGAQMDVDVATKSCSLFVAAEKRVNEATVLKCKVQSDGDLDLALKTELIPGLQVTLCAGMALNEHTEFGQQKVMDEFKK